MAHKTVFAHHKGGTGKTTACVNTAGFLSKKGAKTLVVDADPQANATMNLGLPTEHLDTTLYDLLMHESGMREQYGTFDHRDQVYPTAYGVDVVPGDQKLHDAYSMLWEADGRNEVLSNALAPIEDRYDHVLIDTPSSHLNAISAGIRAADEFFLVLDSSIFSHEGASTLRSFLKRLPDQHEVMMNPSRVLFTENKQRSWWNELWNRVMPKDYVKRSEQLAKSLFGTRFTRVPYCEHVIKSQKDRIPLSHLDSVPDAAQVFDELADDLVSYSWNS